MVILGKATHRKHSDENKNYKGDITIQSKSPI